MKIVLALNFIILNFIIIIKKFNKSKPKEEIIEEKSKTKNKKFINEKENIISSNIEGALLINDHLNSIKDYNIIIRNDIKIFLKNHVTLISGGYINYINF
jgi:hypothetical protein